MTAGLHQRVSTCGWLAAALLGVAVLVAPVGCGGAGSTDSAALRTEWEGQIESAAVRVLIEPTTLSTAQRFTVRIDMPAEVSDKLAPIDLTKALPDGMTIADETSERVSAAGGGAAGAGGVIVRRTFVVEPFTAGEFEIGPIEFFPGAQAVSPAPAKPDKPTASGAPAPPAEESPSPLLSTDAFALTVISVLSQGETELASEKTIVDPAEPPLWTRWWLWAGLVAVAALIALALRAIKHQRELALRPLLIPADQIALARLRELMTRGLVEAGRFKEFYEEASLIMRRYIEHRFGVHAPERTTEEFLTECRGHPAIREDDVPVLRRFLAHCDMVKFAAVVPSTPEAEGVAATVREFVERTRAPEAVVAVPRDGGAAAGFNGVSSVPAGALVGGAS